MLHRPATSLGAHELDALIHAQHAHVITDDPKRRAQFSGQIARTRDRGARSPEHQFVLSYIYAHDLEDLHERLARPRLAPGRVESGAPAPTASSASGTLTVTTSSSPTRSAGSAGAAIATHDRADLDPATGVGLWRSRDILSRQARVRDDAEAVVLLVRNSSLLVGRS